jgi:hypothetical protein
MVNVMTGGGHRVAALVLLAPLLALPSLFACSSSHSSPPSIDDGGASDASVDAALDAPAEAGMDGPNLVPGVCIFQNNVWYCGAGYGTFPSCPGVAGYPLLGSDCDFDGGCLGCMDSVATMFGCQYGSYTIGSTVGTECNH